MKRFTKHKTGRKRTGKTKCRQIGRVPDVIWRNVLKGFYASDNHNFTKWATMALIRQAKADLNRRRELDKIATDILKGTISGQEEDLASRRARLNLLLAEKADAV
jgi:hypothetical protein